MMADAGKYQNENPFEECLYADTQTLMAATRATLGRMGRKFCDGKTRFQLHTESKMNEQQAKYNDERWNGIMEWRKRWRRWGNSFRRYHLLDKRRKLSNRSSSRVGYQELVGLASGRARHTYTHTHTHVRDTHTRRVRETRENKRE